MQDFHVVSCFSLILRCLTCLIIPLFISLFHSNLFFSLFFFSCCSSIVVRTFPHFFFYSWLMSPLVYLLTCLHVTLQVKVILTVRWPWELRSSHPERSTTRWTPSGTSTVSFTSKTFTRTSSASPSLKETSFPLMVSSQLMPFVLLLPHYCPPISL